MSYLVLARKYRPQTFEAVVEQEHVTRTLTNAIRSQRVAHAILFAGPRGTGKTTIARILAKAMNCVDGPTPAPCNECRSCTDITAGSSPDVFEIDGASNNGVEQIRDLRENIRYMPAYSHYKIYIIDEVHMLSIAAFNALLKTLEEPPAHVLFFFATTEPNKIPVTILSRCQRYDLRRIESAALVAHMKQLCHEEGRDVSAQSLSLIAREADGSMRDALSLLDQVLASTEGNVTPDTVLAMVGGVERDLIARMVAGLLNRDISVLLTLLDDAYQRGIDLKKLYGDMSAYLRDAMVVAMGGELDLPLLASASSDLEGLKAAAGLIDAASLNHVFRLVFDNGVTVRLSPDTRLAIEMVFFQVCHTTPAVAVDTLIEKLDQLRTALSLPKESTGNSGSAPPPTGSGGARPSSPPPVTPAPTPSQRSAPEAVRNGEPDVHSGATQKTPPHSGAALPSTGEDREGAWQGCLDAMSRKHPALAAQLRESRLTGVEKNQLRVEMTGNGFHLSRVNRPKNREVLEAFCSAYFDQPLSVVVAGSAQPESDGQDDKKKRLQQLKQELLAHPLVEDAMDIFDGELMDIKILEENAP